ncbi:phosphotransferase [Metabacillus litoralis]|uniref:phosphotransferase n=1 Tax=Metabacillus litoralis TaxID=152268 RepID=UPI001CFCACE4|nr:phosphotransferase [Metabacillus litoralis]
MNIELVIKELKQNKIIQTKITKYEKLTGGTVSELYLLHDSDENKYVVKANEPFFLKLETDFLTCYKDLNMIPNLIFVEPNYQYITYSYLCGTTNKAEVNKQNILQTLVKKVINNYKNVPSDIVGFGYTDELTSSWKAFLLNEIVETNNILKSHMLNEEYDFVLKVCESLNNHESERKRFLIHGDCGVHNFIFNDNHLVGVIDPTPMIGYPLYDLIYAFCSTPDDLTKETLDAAVSTLTIKSEKTYPYLYEELIIGLYLRLGACIKHHPSDFDEYQKAWHYWKKVINYL